MIRGTSAGMYAVVLNEINLAYDRGMERQPWALSYSLSLFPRVTLDVSVGTCSLLCFQHTWCQRRGETESFQVSSKVLVQDNQILKTRVF